VFVLVSTAPGLAARPAVRARQIARERGAVHAGDGKTTVRAVLAQELVAVDLAGTIPRQPTDLTASQLSSNSLGRAPDE
jgi:hypothetical protein